MIAELDKSEGKYYVATTLLDSLRTGNKIEARITRHINVNRQNK